MKKFIKYTSTSFKNKEEDFGALFLMGEYTLHALHALKLVFSLTVPTYPSPRGKSGHSYFATLNLTNMIWIFFEDTIR